VLPSTVSVVIRTYTDQRWDGLVEAVGSLARQTRPPEQVVLVVDHNPALLERARREFAEATVVPSATRGSAGAWNTGVAHARGEVIAFMDDDAVAEPEWLATLLAPYEDGRVAGVGGTIVPAWTGGAPPPWFPPEFNWVVGCTYEGMPEHRAPVRNLIGCNMSFRRAAIEHAGGFREIEGLGHMGGVPVGCDETELCIRMHRAIPGVVLLHEPAAVVRHTVPSSRGAFGYFRWRCALEGRSKAVVSELAGARDGLSTESRYVRSVLPAAVVRGVAGSLRGDPDGLRRAGAIVVGLATTTATYGAARLRAALAARRGPCPTG
jgi:GT2 family glycosyltransferase